MSSQKVKMKTGLVLGGGGARGFAHLGVYKALQEKGVKPDIISGVSAGAIVGAFIASGMDAQDIFNLLRRKKLFDISRIQLPRDGFLYFRGLKEQVDKNIDYKNLEDLPIPLIIAATNLNSGKIEYFSKGPLAWILLASASIPIVFSPVEINGSKYVDGGLIDNLPIKPLYRKVDLLMGVNISPLHEEKNIGSLVQVAKRVFDISVHSSAANEGRKCDIMIEPPGLEKYDILRNNMADEIFKLGYEYTSSLDLGL